jgi:fatty-acid peroxygenase
VIPFKEAEVKEWADDFSGMVDAYGGTVPRHWKVRRARTRTEEWITNIIEEIRTGKNNSCWGLCPNEMANKWKVLRENR